VKVRFTLVPILRLVLVAEVRDQVFEGEYDAWLDLECEVEIERAAARLLGMHVDLPRLAHGVGLDEVALVVDVEAVVRGMVLQVGDEARKIDGCHRSTACQPGAAP
jgi:hypothetical protein